MSSAGVEQEEARPARTDRTERLLALGVVLMGSDVAVSRATIRAGVPGYADSPSDQAFERMFERDKDELRSMGVPIDTVEAPGGEVLGYRIVRDDYALADLELTTAERSAVAVAAQIWGQATVAQAAGAALRKLDAADGDDWRPAGLRGTVQLTASDAALPTLMSAVRERTVVEFPYRGRGDAEPRTRRASPWGLRSAGGAWFVVGHDHDRDDQRTFRLSRVCGAVNMLPGLAAVEPPSGFRVADVPLAPAAGEPVTARVRLAPGRAAAVRRLAAPTEPSPWDATELTVSAGSLGQLVAVVCGAGADAVVIEPSEVVEAVRAALQAVLDAS